MGKKKCSECKADWEICYDFENCPMKRYQKLSKLPITFQEIEDNLPRAKEMIEGKKAFIKAKAATRRLDEVNTSPSELALERRRLADAARMEENMSPSQLALHRRRLTHGAHVSPVLAALMDEIEQAQ